MYRIQIFEIRPEPDMAVYAHAQYIFGQEQPRSTGALSGGLQVAMHSQLPEFCIMFINQLLTYLLMAIHTHTYIQCTETSSALW